MSPGDTFDLTETQIIEAPDLADAKVQAEGMVEDWHLSHWTDCKWEVGDVAEFSTLEQLAGFLKGER
jgi:hypothetical protein